MPRSAADATRFTATGPHAYAKPPSNVSTSSTVDISSAAAAPANETPQQKVARLRAAANRAKQGQGSTFDSVLGRGRVWADRAHRVTVLGLVGLSVVCTGIAFLSIGDMMVYNRRKRRAFFAEQEANYAIALRSALAAEAAGTLSSDLALVLNKERAVQQYEAEQAQKKGIVKGAKDWLFGGLAKEERPGGAMGFASEEIKRIAEGRASGSVEGSEVVRRVKSEDQVMVNKAAAAAAQAQGTPGVVGLGVLAPGLKGRGMLDQMGEQTAQSISATSQGWLDWMRRK